MTHGGPRKNAGRKKGSHGIAVTKTRKIAEEAMQAGQTPLEYMLEVMRTSTDVRRKDAMAQAAAPYVHPRLAAVEHSGDKENPVAMQIITGVPRDKPKDETIKPVNGHANGHDATH